MRAFTRPVPRWGLPIRAALFASLLWLPGSAPAAAQAGPAKGVSKTASDSCAQKVKALADRAATPSARRPQKTRFTEQELNSYLALELKSEYHPSLRSLVLSLGQAKLQAAASIDFDSLGMNSTKFLAKLFARLLTGTHTLSLAGTLVTAAGKGHFVLDDAHFDDSTLPNFLVEEIITSVGKKQKPPFDPLKPSQMPYSIDHVEVHRGFIIVHQ
jgi:hypothetical protein